MIPLPSEIETEFFKVMNGETPLANFEQWVYANADLELQLSATHYLELISLPYSKTGAKYELYKLLATVVDMGRYETYKLRLLIANTMLRDENLPEYLEQFYDLYCHGFNFFRRLGLGLGLSMVYLPVINIGETWKNLTEAEKKQLIKRVTPALEEELLQITTWLDKRIIVITGEKDELNHFVYIDNRSSAEKQNDNNFPVFLYPDAPKGSWWQFWK